MTGKLKLDLGELTVNSFSTSVVEDERGTVQGQEAQFAAMEAYTKAYTWCCPTRRTCTTELC